MKAALPLLALLACPSLEAHPAHAEEVNHPYVAGFERFYSEGDDPAYLTRGGEILLNELNCVACHAAPAHLKGALPGSPGPVMKGLASRFSDVTAVELLMRAPRYLHRGTTMPSVFAGPDRDEEELNALLQYLLSLREPPAAPLYLGVAERGMQLYHTVGCVACHVPDPAFRPAALPDGAVVEAPSLPSRSVRLSILWNQDYLTRFLMDPAKTHPAGRMPNQSLTEQEAADVAAYLKLTDPVGPGLPAPEAGLIEKGRALFSSKGCAACHDMGTGYQPRPAPALAELRDLDGGCLSDVPLPGAVPQYYLSKLQANAIRLALRSLNDWPLEPEVALDRAVTQRDCLACHVWNGRGGPETAREPYFGAGNPYALDRETFLPPALESFLGGEVMIPALTGKAPKRHPKVLGRMPVFSEEEAKALARMFE